MDQLSMFNGKKITNQEKWHPGFSHPNPQGFENLEGLGGDRLYDIGLKIQQPSKNPLGFKNLEGLGGDRLYDNGLKIQQPSKNPQGFNFDTIPNPQGFKNLEGLGLGLGLGLVVCTAG